MKVRDLKAGDTLGMDAFYVTSIERRPGGKYRVHVRPAAWFVERAQRRLGRSLTIDKKVLQVPGNMSVENFEKLMLPGFQKSRFIQKPGSNPEVIDAEFEVDDDHYRMFHGVPPSEVVEMERVWVPGGMVFIGTGKDVGYGISNPDSFKDGWYVHDFGSGVKIYRRCRDGERPTKTWRSFPTQLTNLGWNLGFTYNDGGPNGPMKEVKGSRSKFLAVTPNRKTLVVIDGVGVLYLMEGGAMRVDDWIRD